MESSGREQRKSPAKPAPPVVVRDLATHDDYLQCVTVQRATWGDDFRELVPPAMLMIAQKLGGVAIGAFAPDGSLSGFVFGITGVDDAGLLHWSHMLAVREDQRDRGIGHLLKLSQRDRLRDLGVRRVRWSFDPLVARNAHLNLAVLGARVLEYVEDMYGDNPMSRTDSVIGSDRLVVDWQLDEPGGRTVPPSARRDTPLLQLTPGSAVLAEPPREPAVRIGIPRDIQELKACSPEEARRWRSATRAWFTHYLSHGYLVRRFQAAPAPLGGAYLLQRDDHDR